MQLKAPFPVSLITNSSHDSEATTTKYPCLDGMNKLDNIQHLPSPKKPPVQIIPQDRRAIHFLFPSKLRRILDDAEAENNQHIISWLPDGKSFKVHDPAAFTSQILGRYLCQKRYTSFTRQLYHYGFGKIDTGRCRGAFYHPKFRRDDIQSCLMMDRKSARTDNTDTLQQHLAYRITSGRLCQDVIESTTSAFQDKTVSHTTTVDDMRSRYEEMKKDKPSSSSALVQDKHESFPYCSRSVSLIPTTTCCDSNASQVRKERLFPIVHNNHQTGRIADETFVVPTMTKETCFSRNCFKHKHHEHRHHHHQDDQDYVPENTRDWLSVIENLTWPVDSNRDTLDIVAVSHGDSISLLYEPRSIEEMIKIPELLKDRVCPAKSKNSSSWFLERRTTTESYNDSIKKACVMIKIN